MRTCFAEPRRAAPPGPCTQSVTLVALSFPQSHWTYKFLGLNITEGRALRSYPVVMSLGKVSGISQNGKRFSCIVISLGFISCIFACGCGSVRETKIARRGVDIKEMVPTWRKFKNFLFTILIHRLHSSYCQNAYRDTLERYRDRVDGSTWNPRGTASEFNGSDIHQRTRISRNYWKFFPPVSIINGSVPETT